MVARLCDAALDNCALVAQPLLGPTQHRGQLRQVVSALVAQFDALEVVPDALVRIELGGVSRQLLEMQAARRAPAQEVLHGLAAVDRRRGAHF